MSYSNDVQILGFWPKKCSVFKSTFVAVFNIEERKKTWLDDALKKIFRFLVIMYLILFNLPVYFNAQDVTWNPFKNNGIKESNISFKSLYLSSITNLVLFIFKPMSKDAMKMVYRLVSKTCCKWCIRVCNACNICNCCSLGRCEDNGR